jgi:hypothetical protein
VAGGDKSVLAKLNTAMGSLDNEEALFTKTYNLPAPSTSSTPRLSPTEQAIYDAAKKEGKSDAEIMAFITKMRGGGEL